MVLRPLLAIAFVLLAVALVTRKALIRVLSINDCSMTYMLPSYWEEPGLAEGSYRFFGYGEPRGDSRVGPSHPRSVPVVFLPGSGGDYHQVRSLASAMASEERSDPFRATKGTQGRGPGRPPPLDWYSLHLGEDLTAFSGILAGRQHRYATGMIRLVRSRYPEGSPLVLVGHSLGGTVALRAWAEAHMQDFPPRTLFLFIASPVTQHLWAAPGPSLTAPLRAQLNESTRGDPSLFPVSLSLASGHGDLLVPSALSHPCFSPTAPRALCTHFLDLDTASLSGAWPTSVDHRAMLWCNALVIQLARTLRAGVEALGRAERAGGAWQDGVREALRRALSARHAPVTVERPLELPILQVVEAGDELIIAAPPRPQEGAVVRVRWQARPGDCRALAVLVGSTVPHVHVSASACTAADAESCDDETVASTLLDVPAVWPDAGAEFQARIQRLASEHKRHRIAGGGWQASRLLIVEHRKGPARDVTVDLASEHGRVGGTNPALAIQLIPWLYNGGCRSNPRPSGAARPFIRQGFLDPSTFSLFPAARSLPKPWSEFLDTAPVKVARALVGRAFDWLLQRPHLLPLRLVATGPGSGRSDHCLGPSAPYLLTPGGHSYRMRADMGLQELAQPESYLVAARLERLTLPLWEVRAPLAGPGSLMLLKDPREGCDAGVRVVVDLAGFALHWLLAAPLYDIIAGLAVLLWSLGVHAWLRREGPGPAARWQPRLRGLALIMLLAAVEPAVGLVALACTMLVRLEGRECVSAPLSLVAAALALVPPAVAHWKEVAVGGAGGTPWERWVGLGADEMHDLTRSPRILVAVLVVGTRWAWGGGSGWAALLGHSASFASLLRLVA